MRKYETTFETISNCFQDSQYSPACQEITALVVAPDRMDHNTGAMLFVHGWDCNRHMDAELMEFASDAYNP